MQNPFMNPVILKLAASTLVLGVTMVGCKPAMDDARPRSASQVVEPTEIGANASRAAAAALAGGDVVAAVRLAESAVQLAPQDATYRANLAEIYLKSGRFDSAAAAYRDALQLDPSDSRARLSLALTEIGIGETGRAITTLSSSGATIAPADHGLALALAGDKDGAIRLLTAAAREEGATGRVRQNLALAHALAGDWAQARTIAAQDVPANELDARMSAWAEFAAPKRSYDQVATLLGVVPVADEGQPVRLALNPDAATALLAEASPETAAPEAVQVAAAETDPVVVHVESEPDFAPVEVAANGASSQVVPDEAAPAIAAALASVQSVLPRQMARPISRTIRAAASRSLKGRYVVQLGAFASTAGVERAWNGAVGRFDRLGDYAPASTRMAYGRGSVTRLSVGGFETRDTATDLCNSLRRAGGNCFVRATAGDAPVRWASRATRRDA